MERKQLAATLTVIALVLPGFIGAEGGTAAGSATGASGAPGTNPTGTPVSGGQNSPMGNTGMPGKEVPMGPSGNAAIPEQMGTTPYDARTSRQTDDKARINQANEEYQKALSQYGADNQATIDAKTRYESLKKDSKPQRRKTINPVKPNRSTETNPR